MAILGKLTRGSCAFGVGDIASLIERPELVAHKFYLNFQPAAYFCLFDRIENRSFNQPKFNDSFYRQMHSPTYYLRFSNGNKM